MLQGIDAATSPASRCRCSVLLVSNSSFSFCAAMLATAAAGAAADSEEKGGGGAERGPVSSSGGSRCRAGMVTVRPDPELRRLVPFDPWDASPTLKLAS